MGIPKITTRKYGKELREENKEVKLLLKGRQWGKRRRNSSQGCHVMETKPKMSCLTPQCQAIVGTREWDQSCQPLPNTFYTVSHMLHIKILQRASSQSFSRQCSLCSEGFIFIFKNLGMVGCTNICSHTQCHALQKKT